MVWSHLAATSVNVAYAIVGVFAIAFSLVSSPIKERLYIGEASVATIAGVIFGPFCLKWFIPTEWGTEAITLQISRIVLCIQIFAVAVELPKKYMKKHWISVFILLVPVMTAGWLIIGLFTWIIFKPLNFSQSLLISGCITATDPVLAAAVVGKGKFALKVPGHLRNLLSAESGCNDGMAFPFIFLAMNLIIHAGNAKEIVKDWICVTILYECILGCVLGAIIGWLARRAITLAEKFGSIDRESFLAFYVMLSFASAGLGAVLGVDELLVAFAAGLAFSWNGQYAKKTEDAHVSTAIDLLLNLSYFVYLGALLPWNYYHRPQIGLPFWKYLLLAIVTIFLRRIPAVLALWKFTPDLNTWREALFAGHFGPIGVGAIYAVILARSEIEEHSSGHVTSLTEAPKEGIENYHLILYLWPVVTFLVVASIVIHGSSVAVIVFGKRLRTMSISMTFTQTQGNPNSQGWMSRLPRIDTTGRSFSLHKVDTAAKQDQLPLSEANTIETSGVPARPAGGLKRRRKFRKRKDAPRRERPKTENLDLNKAHRARYKDENGEIIDVPIDEKTAEQDRIETEMHHEEEEEEQTTEQTTPSSSEYQEEKIADVEDKGSSDSSRIPTSGYQEGSKIIIDDQNGEIMSVVKVKPSDIDATSTVKQRKKPTTVSSEAGSTYDLSSVPSSELSRKPSKGRRLSQIQRIRSNVSAKFGSSSTPANKYIAYRVRDEIIIEDNEGEILKRYKIHSHSDNLKLQIQLQQQSATPSFRQRALSLVGLNSQPAKSKEQILEEGGSSAPILVPETEGITVSDNALLRASDNRIQKKLLTLISDESPMKPKKLAALSVPTASDYDDDDDIEDSDDIKVERHHSPSPPGPRAYDFAHDEEEEEEAEEGEEVAEDDSDYDSEDDDEEEEEETEIERLRRLNALGMGNTERNEEDEEDEIPASAPAQHTGSSSQRGTRSGVSGGGMKLKWHSDV